MKKYDVAVLGGGPGGYVAAIRAAKLGKKTALIEKDKLGGTCLNRGCIPTKVLLHSAEVYRLVQEAAEYGVDASGKYDYERFIQRKDRIVGQLTGGVEALVKNAGVDLYHGEGRLIDVHTILAGQDEITADNIILATGSSPALPKIPGIDHESVYTSDDLLKRRSCPSSIAIIGGGVIGIEFATLFSSLDTEVTVVEMLPNILNGVDEMISETMTGILRGKGVSIYTNSKVKEIREGELIFEADAQERKVKAEVIFVAAGRKPDTDDIGLEAAGIKVDQKGFVLVDEYMRTSISGIYAIGDITGKVQLAHVASEQGIVAAHNIAGEKKKMQYDAIPSCIYTEPEIASIGMSEKEAVKRGKKIKTGMFSAIGNGKSKIVGDSNGFVKLISEEETGEILGAHLMASRATDMIAELSAVMRAEGTVDELMETIHPHPTISEMIMEAAHDTKGLSVHKL